jgi:hypothetical protein
MAELLGRDGRNEAIEGAQLAPAAEIEALEHVVPKCRHLSLLATQEFLESRGSVGIRPLGRGQINLELINT